MATLLAHKVEGHHMKQKRKDLIFVLCMLAVPFLNFIVFWIWPNFRSILIAFQVPTIEGFTLFNFERFIGEMLSPVTGPGIQQQIANSFIMFFVGTFVNLPLVLFLSYILFKKIAGYKIFRVLFYLPSILGGTIMSQIYKGICCVGGPIHQLCMTMGIEFDSWAGLLESSQTGMTMLIIYMLWTGVGSNMIMFTGAMNRVPQEIFESARLDGIGFFREFFNIIIPLIWPTVTTMLVFSMVGIFSNAGIVMLLCEGNASCHNIGYYILRYTLGAENTPNVLDGYSYPAAVGLLFTCVNIPLVLGTRWLCERVSKNVEY